MSLKTWKQEFYPIPAREAAEKGMIACIKHSLQKWIGLRQKNLSSHMVGGTRAISNNYGHYEGCFHVDARSCSLCQKYDKTAESCESCPILQATGSACHGWPGSPYGRYICDGDPEPMINTLNRTLEWARKRHGK